jgi:hypothetical protein
MEAGVAIELHLVGMQFCGFDLMTNCTLAGGVMAMLPRL